MDWLVDHFHPQALKLSNKQFPIFLLTDGYSFHITHHFLLYFVDNNILALCLPPHSTHLLQPLDVELFGALQTVYSTEVNRYTKVNFNILRKGNFWPLLKIPRTKAYTKSNILKGWKGSGIWPCNF